MLIDGLRMMEYFYLACQDTLERNMRVSARILSQGGSRM